MKRIKIILLAALIVNVHIVDAQNAYPATGVATITGLSMPASATITGAGRLHVTGTEYLYVLNKSGLMIGKEWGGNGSLTVQGGITLAGSQTISGLGRLHIAGPEYLYLLNQGGVIVGKEFGGTGNLMVEGTILASRVKVAALGSGNWTWADYVFDKGYKLKSLPEVEAYIKANKHLEGMPTTEEVTKDGLDIAPVTAKLLEKIEELTLYMIEMKKENAALKKDVQVLKSKLQ